MKLAMRRSAVVAMVAVWALMLLPGSLWARAYRAHDGDDDHSQVAFGRTIDVREGETASDVVCFFCTIRVHGDVAGNMVAFFGSVDVDPDRSIEGDVVVFGGKLALANDSRVGGDLVVYGGDLEQAGSATVHGSHVVMGGTGWLLLVLVPFLIPIGFVWLVVYLVRRNRYRFPAYPPPPVRY
jgi:hypothetical protein